MGEAQVKNKFVTKETELYLTLREQIKNRTAHIENVRSFERKACVTPGTINNIINGTSSNPTAETLYALANAFGCGIDELLGKQVNQSDSSSNIALSSSSPLLQNSPWNAKLYMAISAELENQIEKSQLNVNSDKALYIILEIYLYLLKKGKNTVEESLISWLLDKSL